MPARIGVVADSPLQGHLLTSAVKTQGFELVANTSPDQLESNWLTSDRLDLWIVDLSVEDKWQGFLDRMLESPVPILFSDGRAPARNERMYPRWERRLLTKMLDYVSKPEMEPVSLQRIRKKVSVNQPIAANFDLDSSSDIPERVCVLGASLGGPEAVKRFLDRLPGNLPVALVLAQHMDEGMLPTLCQVLARDNAFSCVIGEADTKLAYGRVLIMPVTQEIMVNGKGALQATGNTWEGPYAPSIDQTIANFQQRFGKQTTAILFSGMGNDGAIAAPKLAAEGGNVWVQSSESCIMPSQPDATYATGCASYAGTPEQLALQLVNSVKQQLHKPA